ncbi:MAG: preprotein translocase subunit SecG [Desulfobulbaceae bacterium]|nr:preprotein translocase subunit SecG [Desulfobulbaceae bacterium]
MTTLVLSIHIIVCISLVLLVLLQHGKGADMGATFGGSSQTVFGSDGPVPLLNKVTTGAAVIFMVTSMVLAYNSAHSTNSSVMRPVDNATIQLNKQLIEPVPEPITEPAPVEKGAATFPIEDARPNSK